MGSAETRFIAFVTDFHQVQKILEPIGERTLRPPPLTAKTSCPGSLGRRLSTASLTWTPTYRTRSIRIEPSSQHYPARKGAPENSRLGPCLLRIPPKPFRLTRKGLSRSMDRPLTHPRDALTRPIHASSIVHAFLIFLLNKMLSTTGILCYKANNEPYVTHDYEEAVEMRKKHPFEIKEQVRKESRRLRLELIFKNLGIDWHTVIKGRQYRKKLAKALREKGLPPQ